MLIADKIPSDQDRLLFKFSYLHATNIARFTLHLLSIPVKHTFFPAAIKHPAKDHRKTITISPIRLSTDFRCRTHLKSNLQIRHNAKHRYQQEHYTQKYRQCQKLARSRQRKSLHIRSGSAAVNVSCLIHFAR